MSRLIDADAYAEEMKKRQDACEKWMHDAERWDDAELISRADSAWSVFVEAKLTLDKMPTIDAVEVKHGEWVDMGDFEQCSVCHGTHLKEFQSYYGKAIWLKTNYCPNCGAKMDGEVNTDEQIR